VARRSRQDRLGPIILWSGISNSVLAALFIASANWPDIRHFIDRLGKPPLTTIVRAADPLAMARLSKLDRQQQVQEIQSAAKVALEVRGSVILANSWPSGPANDAQAEGDGDYTSELQPASYETGGPETTENGLGTAPIIRRNPSTGKIEIGKFQSMTMEGSTGECLDIAQSLISDAGSSPDTLDVIAASDAITIAKICARNGSVIISCRNDQITISPRHSRPDDMCQPRG